MASDLITGVGLAGSVSVRHFCSVMLTDEDRLGAVSAVEGTFIVTSLAIV